MCVCVCVWSWWRTRDGCTFWDSPAVCHASSQLSEFFNSWAANSGSKAFYQDFTSTLPSRRVRPQLTTYIQHQSTSTIQHPSSININQHQCLINIHHRTIQCQKNLPENDHTSNSMDRFFDPWATHVSSHIWHQRLWSILFMYLTILYIYIELFKYIYI